MAQALFSNEDAIFQKDNRSPRPRGEYAGLSAMNFDRTDAEQDGLISFSSADLAAPAVDMAAIAGDEEAEFRAQGEGFIDLVADHFKGTGIKMNNNVRLSVVTNGEIAILRNWYLPVEFVQPKSDDMGVYLEDVIEEVKSLCATILVEADEGLTEDARVLKRRLAKVFEKCS